MKYRYLVSQEAIAIYGTATKRQRSLLENAFQQIAAFPDLADETWSVEGFDYSSRRFGNWEVAYRVDAPVFHIHIVQIANLHAP